MGKTFLSKNILEQAYPSGRYFNWDFTEDQQDLLSLKWHDDDGLIVFDELHKYKNWLDVLERMYLVFAVPSYTKNLPRAVIKPPKFFFMTIMWLSLLPIFCIPHKCQLGSEMK